ncbi:MAG TPA: potassium-transporting ATPase subunit KdpC [Stellaceae bacterium]|jgi:K+-transporting ATPase ATPase C chain|nr:potassium-transporting ATPase subunit KdpC [Stellaceae bacterium]
MLRQFRPALVLLLVMTGLTGLAYPLAVTGVAAILFPYQSNGSLIEQHGKVIGSVLIGQNFTQERYFHGRPSATTDTDPNNASKTIAAPYNAGNSGGSNAGPTSKALIDRIATDVAALKKDNAVPIPVDLVTTSASGLDPDITPAAAEFQAARVAAARHLPVEKLRALVAQATENRSFGIFGEPRVNVLKLNLALDAIK